ncbi:hypothetical protein PVAND_016525 [Polypedilum vanderplanki]|uniref:Peptidase S54 rhomboid domain-containing protein n=1 Tax=Polypedilum vanderplanki TaxID=319348 RepID=A0A9J6BFP0_POLVA|nr:hypothetical protein PVAND_016525 [Polypedilum vanderplanki]
MTDGFLKFLKQSVRVAPKESSTNSSPRSWNDKSLLTTEQKIYAISNGLTQDIEAAAVGNYRKKKEWKESVKKWIDKSPWGLPWIMIIFSAIQLIFNNFHPSDDTYQALAFSLTHKSEIWRFLTYSLLHAGTAHLIINIVLQLVIALPLETEIGHVRVCFVYFGGILFGSLAASLNDDGMMMVGASSGVYGLLLSHLAHLYLNNQKISFKIHRIVFVTVLTLGDIIHSLTHCLINNNEEPKIHIIAHLAGGLSGLLLGFIFYQDLNESKEIEEEKIAKGAKLIRNFSIIFLVLISFLIFSYSSQQNNDDNKLTFNKIYMQAFENFNEENNVHHLLKDTKRECVRTKLKLEENGEKIVGIKLGLAAVRAAASVCLENSTPAFEAIFNRKVMKIQSSGIQKEKVNCLKLKLYELNGEENSDILGNFEPCDIENVEEECSTTFEAEKKLWKILMNYKKIDKSLGIENCLNRNHKKKKERSQRLIVLVFTQPENENLMNEERRRALLRYKSLNQKLYDCVMEKIEEIFEII